MRVKPAYVIFLVQYVSMKDQPGIKDVTSLTCFQCGLPILSHYFIFFKLLHRGGFQITSDLMENVVTSLIHDDLDIIDTLMRRFHDLRRRFGDIASPSFSSTDLTSGHVTLREEGHRRGGVTSYPSRTMM
jgi:hypothetical protein